MADVLSCGDLRLVHVRGTSMMGASPSTETRQRAARGGPHASDGFVYSGSNDIDEVAWYGGPGRPPTGSTTVHAVGLKKPNQLGLYDMTGNVWNSCEAADFRGPAIGFRLVLV